jgi:pyruvate dehydrogenase E1 component alpha subunit
MGDFRAAIPQTGAQTLAQKAIAAGIPGEQVDGNDIIAVSEAARRAIETARAGGGAAVIEALTYRLGDHTTVDDARRYREDSEVSRHWELEPIARVRKYLTDLGAWNKADEVRRTRNVRLKSVAADNISW